jgi:hypothetical protein
MLPNAEARLLVLERVLAVISVFAVGILIFTAIIENSSPSLYAISPTLYAIAGCCNFFFIAHRLLVFGQNASIIRDIALFFAVVICLFSFWMVLVLHQLV